MQTNDTPTQLTQILTPQEVQGQSCFKLQNLPLPEVAHHQVLPYPSYGEPTGFVYLEVQRNAPKLIAHVVETKNLSKKLEIPLPLTDKIIAELQSPELSIHHVPFHAEVDLVFGGLYLVAFNTLWNLYLDPSKAPHAEIGYESYDLNQAQSAQTKWANQNILRYQDGKIVSQNQDLITQNSKFTVRANAENLVAVSDNESGQVFSTFTLRKKDGPDLIQKIQLVGESAYLAAKIGDHLNVIDLKAQKRRLTIRCTDFHVNQAGLVAIYDRQTIKVMNLLQGKHLLELSTSSASQYVHLTDETPHVIHGNQCFKLNLHNLKRITHQSYKVTTNGYQFTTRSSKATFQMTTSDLIRYFTSSSRESLSRIHGRPMIQTQNEVLQFANDHNTAVVTEFSKHDQLLPILEASLKQSDGFFAPLKSGQIYFTKLHSSRKHALLSDAILDHLRVSELTSMKHRVEAHQDEVAFDMYMRWLHGQKPLCYQHHLVAITPNREVLVTATHWNALRFWDTKTGKLIQQLDIPLGETLLDEAVAQCVFLPGTDRLLVIMHSGLIYRVNHYLNSDAKFEFAYQVTGFNRIEVTWVQHQRYALISKGCEVGSEICSDYKEHPKPVVLDLTNFTTQEIPDLHEHSYTERPLAICSEGRYLLIDAATTVGEHIIPFHQRVVDLLDERRVTSWVKSDDFIKQVSNMDSYGVFHALSEDMKLRTFQWNLAKA